MTNYIADILSGKRSNAVIQFFCGEYFHQQVTAHPRFTELQELYWSIETNLYNRLSKKSKLRRSLKLTSHVSGFFSNPNDESNQVLLSIQQEILGEWAKVHHYFGVDIDWHEVFKSAYESGNVTKTNADFDKVESLQDIPRY